MTKTIHSEFWFPQQIIISQDLEFNKVKNNFLNYCKKEKNIDKFGLKNSNCGGWQSKSFYPNKNNIWIYEYIMSHVKPALYSQLQLVEGTDFSIENFWINLSNTNSYNDYHSHLNSDYSGCLYIQIEEKSGSIQFNPNLNYNTDWMSFLNEDHKNNFKIYPSIQCNPKEGTILLFPSHLMHKVNANLSNKERISIAFNIKFFKNF
jgi:uncharacterized protein (TIGR02466 family)